jgi:hypothetical protein
MGYLYLLLSIALSLTLGYLLIDRLVRAPSHQTFEQLSKFALGAAAGMGLSSSIYFVGLLLFTPSGGGLRIFDTAIHLGAILVLFMIGRKPSSNGSAQQPPPDITANCLIYRLFWASLVVSILTLGLMALQSPYGGQDALSIWNLRARVLLKGQGSWLRDLATLGQHPDYPLLLPSLVARFWSYFGCDVWWVPFIAQELMLYSAIVSLAALIARLRGIRMGLLAGWALLGTPFFLRESAGLQADVALAGYVLAAVALIGLKECCCPASFGVEVAAGLMAALAAWTKNEGLLFLVVLLAVRALTLCRRSGLKAALHSLWALVMGMLPVLVLLVYFKLQIAPANDLLAGQNVSAFLARMSDPSRYIRILAAFTHGMLAFDRWQIYPLLLAAYLGLNGTTRRPEDRFAGMTILIVILSVLGGYFCVYLTTPHDLHWHLRTALHRLLLQVWPATLYMVFLLVRQGKESGRKMAEI